MAARFDVCVVGSANLDLVARVERLPGPGETVLGSGFAEHPGGKGLNQAVAAARAGARVAMCAALGDDPAGAVLRAVLDGDGIDAAAVATVGEPTGRAMIAVAANGENSIVVIPGANARASAAGQPPSAVVLAQLEVPLDTVRAALRAGRACGATTILNPAPAQPLDESLLALCDVVVPNEHEVELLGGAGRLLALGARAIVVTLGADGAAVHTAAGVETVRAFPVEPVDTTGAGDTFCGALAARLASGDELQRALRYASAAAALSTTKVGAVPSVPRAAEVLALLNA